MTEPTVTDPAGIAARALALLDLTDLGETCTPEAVDALCRDARAGGVAAVCVWPRFVALAARGLAGSSVRVATVVNFPAGAADAAAAAAETRAALIAGADEIDLVLPYRALMAGDEAAARAVVAGVREAAGAACLKVILETGVLVAPGLIERAGQLALTEGADFLKTSTGKTPVSATPEAVRTLLAVLREAGHGGLKVSGGLRRLSDAGAYLALADAALGPDWARPGTMRLGASSLFPVLMAARA